MVIIEHIADMPSYLAILFKCIACTEVLFNNILITYMIYTKIEILYISIIYLYNFLPQSFFVSKL